MLGDCGRLQTCWNVNSWINCLVWLLEDFEHLVNRYSYLLNLEEDDSSQVRWCLHFTCVTPPLKGKVSRAAEDQYHWLYWSLLNGMVIPKSRGDLILHWGSKSQGTPWTPEQFVEVWFTSKSSSCTWWWPTPYWRLLCRPQKTAVWRSCGKMTNQNEGSQLLSSELEEPQFAAQNIRSRSRVKTHRRSVLPIQSPKRRWSRPLWITAEPSNHIRDIFLKICETNISTSM